MGFTLSSSPFRSSFSSLRAQHLRRQLSGALISRQGNSSSMMLFSPNCILDGILMDFCLAIGPRYACWSLWPWPCPKGGDPSKANFVQYFHQRVLSEIPRFDFQLFFKISIDMILLFVDPNGLRFLIVVFHWWTHVESGC